MVTRSSAAWGVPLYVHPAEDPSSWTVVADRLRSPDFVVVNVSSGPGPRDDAYYPDALSTLSEVPLLGYVDLDYGARASDAVRQDARDWAYRYGVGSVFLDQAPSQDTAGLGELLTTLRADGTSRVVANPGTRPTMGILAICDICVTFEGRWADYRKMTDEDVVVDADPSRIWHLVYDCPPEEQQEAHTMMIRRGAGVVGITDGVLPNPFDRLPAALSPGSQVGRR